MRAYPVANKGETLAILPLLTPSPCKGFGELLMSESLGKHSDNKYQSFPRDPSFPRKRESRGIIPYRAEKGTIALDSPFRGNDGKV